MYRGSSPLFDVPEFPTLRRVKPLPKRRRTSPSDSDGDDATSPPTSHNDIDIDTDTAVNSNGNGLMLPSSLALAGLQLPGPDATAEELLAHADALSAHMAIQSYYMPILGGVQDLFRSTLTNDFDSDLRTGTPTDGRGGGEFGAGYSSSGGGGGGGRDDDDDQGDGDYIDHLTQPGNTKKRKVPANASGSPNGHDPGSGQSGGEDEPTERSVPTGRAEHDAAEIFQAPPSFGGSLGQRKGRLSAATLAGLQHKEMLKSRKRQLAAVLGALSHGDTLALDQALSANYPFPTSGFDMTPPKVRLSRRPNSRLARKTRLSVQAALPREPNNTFPECAFTFVCPSATSERLIATKEEVALLRSRFEAELARQASKAAKLSEASKMKSSPARSGRRKRSDRAQQRARTTGTPGGARGGDQTAEFLDQSALGIKPRGGKKKKRSALANASNPHHLRNYVPSRLPHSGQTNPSQTSQNYLGPLPMRFLSAEIPPRRRKKTQTPPAMPQLTNPADEWICAFCEYELFYGDDQDYRRAVRNRKKILRRRRRARERAAAAASGTSTTKGAEKSAPGHEEYEAGYEPSGGEFSSGVPKQNKWKGDPNKEGGDHASFG